MPCLHNIEKSKDEDTYQEKEFQLECKIHSDQDYCTNQWKKCTWIRSQDNMKCFVHHQSDDSVTTSCDGAMKLDDSATKKDGRIEFDTSKMKDGVCRIKVTSSSFKDTGTWTCSVEPCMDTEDEGTCKRGTGKKNEASIEVKVSFIFV